MIALIGTSSWMSGLARTLTDRHFDANARPVRVIKVRHAADAKERLRGTREHVEIITMPSEYLTFGQFDAIEFLKWWNDMVGDDRAAARKRNLDSPRPGQ